MDMYFYTNLFFLIFGNALAWYLVVYFFNINSLLAKLILGAVFLVLSISTFIAFVAVNKKDNWFVRFYYTLSFSWLGILLNFGLSALFLFLSSLVLSIFAITIPAFLFKILLAVLTIVLSLKSFYNANRILVKKETVFINNLPTTWCDKKVIHISDVHLGPILRQNFFFRVTSKIKELEPEAIFITGDLFDGSEADFSWIKKPLNNLKAPLGVYYSFGNHDFTLGTERVKELLSTEDVSILDNRLLKKEGVQIIGLNFNPDRNFDLKREILSQSGYRADEPSILLFHEPKDTLKSQGLGIDLQLSGHTHGGQMFPFNFLSRYYYHNHSHGLYRRGDYTLCVTAGVGTWGPPMRLGTRSEIIEITLRKK